MRRGLLLLTLILLAAAPQDSAKERRQISFSVDATTPATGRVQVQMKLEGLRKKSLTLAIPAWAPGAYYLKDYSENISEVSAVSGEKKLTVVKGDKRTWTVAAENATPVTIRYQLRLKNQERGGITKDHCDFQGPDSFLYVVGHKNVPHQISYTLPKSWRVATGLERRGDAYFARDYDTFIDCPTELGTFDFYSFTVREVLFEIAVHSEGEYDAKLLVKNCRKTVAEQMRLFGGAPFKRYVFLYHFRRGLAGGGLEHLNSTSISLLIFPGTNLARSVSGVTSHEFFHLWNVKRIRPKVLGPFDYSKPVRTRDLWFLEGVTSYYGDLLLARANVWSHAQFLRAMTREIETLRNNPDHRVTSAEQASWQAWDPGRNSRISYYNKGQLLGWLIDFRIRQLTGNRKSLDDVMRYLNETHVKNGKGPIGQGYEVGGLQKAIELVSGHDFSEFFKKYVSGLENLPFETVLAYGGIDCQLNQQESPVLGISLSRMRVSAIAPGAKTELKVGDKLLEYKGEKLDLTTLRELTKKQKVGNKITLKIERDGKAKDLEVTIGRRVRTMAALSWNEEPTALQRSIRNSWLGIREY